MTERFFEMLWDCEQCATHGLLAKSQRHCPACGAAQDPAKRYFPEEGKEVEVLGHQYVGADWTCAYCQSPNGASAAFCSNCGGSRDGTKEVKLVADKAAEPPTPPAPPAATGKPSGKGGWGRIIAVAVLVVMAILGYRFFSKHDEIATVSARNWLREVEIEKFVSASESAWCDTLPTGAYQVSRNSEERSKRKVEDGQECKDKRVDKGDGTFTVQQDCKPRFREEPVYDMKCRFKIDRWQKQRSEQAKGDGLLAPAWPTPSLVAAGPAVQANGLGRERAGKQRESYSVQLTSAGGQQWTCEVAPALWATLKEQQRVKLKVRGTGGADCASLGSDR